MKPHTPSPPLNASYTLPARFNLRREFFLEEHVLQLQAMSAPRVPSYLRVSDISLVHVPGHEAIWHNELSDFLTKRPIHQALRLTELQEQRAMLERASLSWKSSFLIAAKHLPQCSQSQPYPRTPAHLRHRRPQWSRGLG